MAFVVVLHLSPEHESQLAQILQTTTKMTVVQVTETVKVRPDHVYVIPPVKHLAMLDGHIHLQEPEQIRGRRVPIDLFFRTLGEAYGRHAIAVILSGTGSDGTLGIGRVKENGGIVFAQTPDDAEYDGMPRSAINTKFVDVILPVAELPHKIVAIGRAAKRHELKGGTEERIEVADQEHTDLTTLDPTADQANALREVLALLKVRTGHDFHNYKRPTLLRRIARRFQVHELGDMAAYLTLLREQPNEVQALLNDLLISVTNFFRDKEAFSVLEHDIIPNLFTNKTANDTVRVWSCGCATGEEAYSLAILLSEYAAKLNDPPKLQVFASDISERAIRTARAGCYDETLVADLSPERLQRFFFREDNQYRVKKELRDLVLFAPHNVLRDPPFSKLDLIVCRNLLIYLNRDTQYRILDIFSFALQGDGYLFLGSSESAEGGPISFTVLDKKQRLYQSRRTAKEAVPSMPVVGKWNAPILTAPSGEGASLFGTLHQRSLELINPPSVLVSETNDLVHLSESAGKFLRLGPGEPSRDLLKLVDPLLKTELQAALLAARQEGRRAETAPMTLNLYGNETSLKLAVQPLESRDAEGYALVVFEELREVEPQTVRLTVARDDGTALGSTVQRLEAEVERLREQLRLTLEQGETTHEEHKAANEELQAINEELRSASEELETSKEELQSVNEELITVNHELKDKVDALGHVNADLQNLIGSTDIGTIFLDRSLTIKRYTPLVKDLFNIIASDVGRPLVHLTHKLDYDRLSEDAAEVLSILHLKEREVRNTADDSRYLVRLAPYRTLEDKIDGVVLSFQDITKLKRAGDALSESEERLRVLIENLPGGAVFVVDQDLRYLLAEGEALYAAGFRPEALVGRTIAEALPPELAQSYEPLYRRALAGEPFEHEHEAHGLSFISRGIPLRNSDGGVGAVLAVSYNITERRAMEDALRAKEAELDTMMNQTPFMLTRCTKDLRYRFVSPAYAAMLHRNPDDIAGKPIIEVMGEEGFKTIAPYVERVLQGERVEYEAKVDFRSDGAPYLHVVYTPDRDDAGNVVGWFASIVDITERRRAEEALRASEQALQEADKRKDEFLAVLAHELRNPLAPIRTSIEIMKRTKDQDTEKEARAVIERQVDHIVRLVDDLLDVSRISRGKITLQKQKVTLLEVINLAIESSGALIEEKQHELKMSLPQTPVVLEADKTRLSQVFSNLLNNAAKYTAPGGEISLSADLEGSHVVVRVRDNGLGIPPEHLSGLFELFTRLERDAGQEGLGIGLNLVRQLVKLHGGTVEACSAGSSQGSEFTVRLPVVLEEETSPVKALEEKATEAAPRDEKSPRRVLVIDDYEPNRKTIARLLRLMGHEVQTAGSGEEGLEGLKNFQAEVILLDLNMPGMNGFETARRIRGNPALQNVTLVALTGYGQEEDLRKTKEAGFDAHLVKPVEIKSLEQLLAEGR